MSAPARNREPGVAAPRFQGRSDAIYGMVMNETIAPSSRLALQVALGLAFAVAATLAFAGWMRFGAEIVLTFTENGLSLCL